MSVATSWRRCALGAIAWLVCVGAEAPRETTVSREAFACTSWAGWHEYTLASLTPRGGRIDKNCPIRIPAGTKVTVIEDDDGSGASTITYRGKTWVVDNDRLK